MLRPMLHMFSILSRRRRRAHRSRLPGLDGFSDGRRLRLPPGELVAEQGVCVLRDRLGEHVLPLHDEAWVAFRLDGGAGWYALWCPHALRWELLGFEADRATVPYAPRPRDAVRRQRNAG